MQKLKGNFTTILNRIIAIYNKYAEEQIKAAFGGKHDWSIFEKEIASSGFSYGKVTGTSVILKAYSHLRALKIS